MGWIISFADQEKSPLKQLFKTATNIPAETVVAPMPYPTFITALLCPEI